MSQIGKAPDIFYTHQAIGRCAGVCMCSGMRRLQSVSQIPLHIFFHWKNYFLFENIGKTTLRRTKILVSPVISGILEF